MAAAYLQYYEQMMTLYDRSQARRQNFNKDPSMIKQLTYVYALFTEVSVKSSCIFSNVCLDIPPLSSNPYAPEILQRRI